jgi:hypothetical protein
MHESDWQKYMDFSGFADTLRAARKATLRQLTVFWPTSSFIEGKIKNF